MNKSYIEANTLVPGDPVSGTIATQRGSRGGILLKDRLSPRDYNQIKDARGVICADGGRFDHSSELCRILGTPVMQTPDAQRLLAEGEEVTLSPTAGKIYKGRRVIRSHSDLYPHIYPAFRLIAGDPETRVQVSVIGASEIARSNATSGYGHVPGSFFVREEFIWLTRGILDPFEYVAIHGVESATRLLKDALGACLKEMRPLQALNFRSLDMRTDEYSTGAGLSERNPDLGWHGIRRSLQQSGVLKAALQAVHELSAESGDRVLFTLPFINEAYELDGVVAVARDLGIRRPRIGVFVETPAAVSEVDYFLQRGVKEIYIGTKDLSQTIMSADRSNARVAGLADPKRRPVMEAIQKVVSACSAGGARVYLFSSLADAPFFTERFPDLTGVSICCAEYERLIKALPRAA